VISASVAKSAICRNRRRRFVFVVLAGLAVTIPSGACRKRVAVDRYPAGTLRVRYAPAGDYTDCLIASVVMCANYVVNAERYTTAGLRRDLEAAGLDHTRVGDLQAWLADQAFQMTPLRGDLTRRPPLGLGWWVLERGYPVICVINKHAGNPEFNHAVLVIGLDLDDDIGRVTAVSALDPASEKRLVRWDRSMFAHYWGSAGRVMLPLFERPAPRTQTGRAGVQQ
jgi:hypothetical protein